MARARTHTHKYTPKILLPSAYPCQWCGGFLFLPRWGRAFWTHLTFWWSNQTYYNFKQCCQIFNFNNLIVSPDHTATSSDVAFINNTTSRTPRGLLSAASWAASWTTRCPVAPCRILLRRGFDDGFAGSPSIHQVTNGDGLVSVFKEIMPNFGWGILCPCWGRGRLPTVGGPGIKFGMELIRERESISNANPVSGPRSLGRGFCGTSTSTKQFSSRFWSASNRELYWIGVGGGTLPAVTVHGQQRLSG